MEMASQPTSEPPSTMALPSDFKTIREILDMDVEHVTKKKPIVDVIGLIKDYQPPMPTRKTDWKMTLTIVDLSTEKSYEADIMKVNVFCPKEAMPDISSVAQPVLIRKFKVQVHAGSISLISTFRTEIHVFQAQMPSDQDLPKSASRVGKVTSAEAKYIAWLQKHIKRDAFPDSKDFKENAAQALNIKEKYSELKDVKTGQFCDLIGEVVHIFEASSDRVTVYLTDYTSNNNFYDKKYNQVIPGVGPTSGSRDGDDYGYMAEKQTKASKGNNEWPGPYGQMSIQLTAFDSHGDRFKELAKVGSWVKLSNVHVVFPKTGGPLEAKLRRDPRDQRGRVQVEILVQPEDPEWMDFRWKNALRRKRDYYARVKKQKREFEEEMEKATRKRKHDETEPTKINSKNQRKERRKALRQKFAQKSEIEAIPDTFMVDKPVADELNLNAAVKCNKQSDSPVPLVQILNHNRRFPVQTDNGIVFPPFVNANYRANIRVTDFFPHKLEDFSVGRKPSEFECLSEYDTSSDEEDTTKPLHKGMKQFVINDDSHLKWSWRFALQVEDAAVPADAEKGRIWLLLDNECAQCLLGEDATNLRAASDELDVIREKFFVLWGDLEERKSAYLKSAEGKALLQRSLERPNATNDTPPPPKINQQSTFRPGDQPPDSDDEELAAKTHPGRTPAEENLDPLENVKNASPQQAAERLATKLWEIGDQAQNKPFPACIREYGVKVVVEDQEEDAEEDDEESTQKETRKRTRWERQFGLFGTTIF